MRWLPVLFDFARHPGKNLEAVRKSVFPHLSPSIAVALVIQAVVCLTIYCFLLPRLFSPSMYWDHGATICNLAIVGWYSAVLALRNHAIGYVMQGLVTLIACLAASVVLVINAVLLVESAASTLKFLFPFAIMVSCLRVSWKGFRWIRIGLRRMKSEKSTPLKLENTIVSQSVDSTIADQVKAHHA